MIWGYFLAEIAPSNKELLTPEAFFFLQLAIQIFLKSFFWQKNTKLSALNCEVVSRIISQLFILVPVAGVTASAGRPFSPRPFPPAPLGKFHSVPRPA